MRSQIHLSFYLCFFFCSVVTGVVRASLPGSQLVLSVCVRLCLPLSLTVLCRPSYAGVSVGGSRLYCAVTSPSFFVVAESSDITSEKRDGWQRQPGWVG